MEPRKRFEGEGREFREKGWIPLLPSLHARRFACAFDVQLHFP